MTFSDIVTGGFQSFFPQLTLVCSEKAPEGMESRRGELLELVRIGLGAMKFINEVTSVALT
jgi:hypothetical protein